MKALLCHCKKFRTKVINLSSAPHDIDPEPINERTVETKDSIAVLVTVEKGDSTEEKAPLLAEEVRKMSKDIGHTNIVLLPFAHLSNRLADSRTAIDFMSVLETELKDFNIDRVHFGSDKELLLDIYGHRGNVRYREF